MMRFIHKFRWMIIAVIVIILFHVLFGGAYNIITTGSMSPDIVPYDMVLVNVFTPYENIQVGDIISFKKPYMSDPVLHRVVERGDALTTKGDANPEPIKRLDYDITEEEYIGKLHHVVSLGEYGMLLMFPMMAYWAIPTVLVMMCADKKFRKLIKK